MRVFLRLALLLALAASFGAAAGCSTWTVPVEPPPIENPPPPPPPVDPPPDEPPPTGGLPAVGAARADVEAALGKGTDLPENPGEDDVVAYLLKIDGKDAEVHVVYRGGRVLRSVVTFLVTPGGT